MDEGVETLTDKRHRKGRYHDYTGHITLTERDGTGQHKGGEGSRERGESAR